MRAWSTSISSSRASASRVVSERRDTMTSTWAAVMSPSLHAREQSGRCRSSRPRCTWRRAWARGRWHIEVNHADALRAPSGTQFPAASKAAVASVTMASRRASWRWRCPIDSVSANADRSDPLSSSSAAVRTSRSMGTVHHPGVTLTQSTWQTTKRSQRRVERVRMSDDRRCIGGALGLTAGQRRVAECFCSTDRMQTARRSLISSSVSVRSSAQKRRWKARLREPSATDGPR
jgi:hypothetical protein